MAKVRQDAWSHEDDLLLAETVLRHIREGSTQLNAFEEVGDELNRTSAACGFRWNAEVRNKYIQAIDLAKRQRKEKKRAQAAGSNSLPKRKEPLPSSYAPVQKRHELIMEPEEETDTDLGHINLGQVIHYLQNLQHNLYQSNRIKTQTDKLQHENEALLNKVTELEKELKLKEKKLNTVEEDYHTFIQIMERARKMTVLEDQANSSSPTFKMDKNGNLEQVIQSNTN